MGGSTVASGATLAALWPCVHSDDVGIRLAATPRCAEMSEDIVEAFVLPHLGSLAFARGLRQHVALQAAITEALLAAAQRRPPLSGEAVDCLVLRALQEQARKLPENDARVQEAIRQLQARS